MENAVKALYIAAGVLIAVLVLSLAVVLYSSLQSYVENSHKQIKNNDISSFNTKYLNYINYVGGKLQFELTPQDIVTVANMAYENNIKYNSDPAQWDANENSLYVKVTCVGLTWGEVDWNNRERLDTRINELMISILEHKPERKYYCYAEDVDISSKTGQVYSINFRYVE